MPPPRPLLAVLLTLLLWLGAGYASAAAGDLPRRVIVLFTDGTGTAHLEAARHYARVVQGRELHLTKTLLPKAQLGWMSVTSADSLVTDSAAAATAMSGGAKTNNGSVGVTPDGAPLTAVAELARQRGLAVGLVSNAAITDASPAGFGGGHSANRRDQRRIAQQLLAQRPHLLLGGGRGYWTPTERHPDTPDLLGQLPGLGYRLIQERAQLLTAERGPLVGLFANGDLPLDTDRDPDDSPSLAEMTAAALRILAGQERFFLFVENEHTDTASHSNDAANALRHLLDFDQAVALASQYQQAHPETLLIVTTDHECGGLTHTMALKDLTTVDPAHRTHPGDADFQALAQVSISLAKAARQLGDQPDDAAIDALLRDHFPGYRLDDDLRERLHRRQPLSRAHLYRTTSVLGELVARRTHLFWGGGNHTNQWAFVAAHGPGAQRFGGFYDNTDFAKRLHALLRAANP